jgi:hypothetical protein
VDSGGWAIQRVDECIVGCPYRFCPDRNLGLHAIGLALRSMQTLSDRYATQIFGLAMGAVFVVTLILNVASY